MSTDRAKLQDRDTFTLDNDPVRHVTLLLVGSDDLERKRQRRRELLSQLQQIDEEIEREEQQADVVDLSPAERRKLWRIITGGANLSTAAFATALTAVIVTVIGLSGGTSSEQDVMEPPRAIGALTPAPKNPDELDPWVPDEPGPPDPDVGVGAPGEVEASPTSATAPIPRGSPSSTPSLPPSSTPTPTRSRPPPPTPTSTPTRPGTPTPTKTPPPTPSPSPTPSPTHTPTPTPTPTPTETPDEDYLLCLELDLLELEACLDLLGLGGLDLLEREGLLDRAGHLRPHQS